MTYSSAVAYFTVGPTLTPYQEAGGAVWVHCELCPGWTAVADDFDELFRLVSEWHAGPLATHKAWTMYRPFTVRPPNE